jgi:hypothetical protein
MLMVVKQVADAQEVLGSSLRASLETPYFRMADHSPRGFGFRRTAPSRTVANGTKRFASSRTPEIN